MTREQLIREMIQIELLYQTQQKLLNENKNNTQTTTFPIEVGNKSGNTFINTLSNDTIHLSKQYPARYSITELEYAKHHITKKDINLIWDYLKEKLHAKLKIPKTALGKILDFLKAKDKNIEGKVFSIFDENNKDRFPLQTLIYTPKNLSTLATQINNNLTNELYKEIFKSKLKDDNQTFNSGKGEFLTVLLTNDAESGGTKKLDVVVGGSQFDVKQISQHEKTDKATGITTKEAANYLSLTLSEKSGLRNPKNKFVNAQAKLGQKINQLTSEFKKLGVDANLIKKLETYEGYTSSAFRRSSTTSDSDDDADTSNKYLSFADMGEIITQGVRALKANTYTNIETLKNFKKTVFTQKKFVNNIDKDVIDFLKNCYDLDLKTFSQMKDKEEISKLSIDVINNSSTKLFKKLNANNYNNLIDKNIRDTNVANYFKINPDYTPIFYLGPAAKNNSQENFDIFKSSFEKISDFNSFFQNKNKEDFFKINNYGRADIADANTFRGVIENTLNKQIVLTTNQMIKINSIIQKNNDIDLEESEGKISNVNNNTIINNQYFVMEPLRQTDDLDLGEFIIDISYYNNMKKKHVDTLYSKDFQIQNSSDNKLKKSNKSAKITNDDEKSAIPLVTINLEDVISDRDTINDKLKNFQLFDNLQPSVLKDLFLTYNKNTKQDFLSDNSLNIINNLKSIKENTKEDNILSIIYEMYESCNQIEEEIKNYYINNNEILIYKDDGSSRGGDSIPKAAYAWGQVIDTLKQKNIDSFIMQIGHDQILCYADIDDNSLDVNKFDSVKNLIKKLFNEVMDLMLDLQSITTKA